MNQRRNITMTAYAGRSNQVSGYSSCGSLPKACVAFTNAVVSVFTLTCANVRCAGYHGAVTLLNSRWCRSSTICRLGKPQRGLYAAGALYVRQD
jgi:hypothetical protein